MIEGRKVAGICWPRGSLAKIPHRCVLPGAPQSWWLAIFAAFTRSIVAARRHFALGCGSRWVGGVFTRLLQNRWPIPSASRPNRGFRGDQLCDAVFYEFRLDFLEPGNILETTNVPNIFPILARHRHFVMHTLFCRTAKAGGSILPIIGCRSKISCSSSSRAPFLAIDIRNLVVPIAMSVNFSTQLPRCSE